jgi:glucan endo-1,3-alpha-glucosidase
LTLELGRISDAVALNFGSDDWEEAQIANAYAAAKSLGTGFKLFLSFDFTAMACDLSYVVSLVNTYSNHPNQFKIDGKPMISSYEGGCLGNSGWESLIAQTNGYTMPFISGLEGQFPQWPALDSWYWLV